MQVEVNLTKDDFQAFCRAVFEPNRSGSSRVRRAVLLLFLAGAEAEQEFRSIITSRLEATVEPAGTAVRPLFLSSEARRLDGRSLLRIASP